MATRKGQRIGIWIIAGAMIIGTVGGFIAMMVAPANEAKDRAELEAQQMKWSDEMEKWEEETAKRRAEYIKKQDDKAKKLGLSDKHYPEFSKYASRVGKFKAEDVKELEKKDLKVGKGEEIKGDTRVAMYYIGWKPDGDIFDQSIDGKKLKTPFAVDGPNNENVIAGWKEGLIGMKIGGVRELTIPSDMGYGGQGTDNIPPDTPLKFIVMAIPSLGIEQPKPIPQPEMPPLVKKEYEKYGL